MSDIDKIISDAVTNAVDNNHEYVTLEHLMLSLLSHDSVIEILSTL